MAKGVKTGGRIAGQPNKMTRGIKANILDVFDKIGGVQYFSEWAKENPTEFYKHYIKLLPTEMIVEASVEQTNIKVRPSITPEQWMIAHGVGTPTGRTE